MNTTTHPDHNDSPQLPESFQARITDKVLHRVGDGMVEEIPMGIEVRVDMAMASMVLSWTSEGQPVNVTVAREEFMHYVDTGAIQILH